MFWCLFLRRLRQRHLWDLQLKPRNARLQAQSHCPKRPPSAAAPFFTLNPLSQLVRINGFYTHQYFQRASFPVERCCSSCSSCSFTAPLLVGNAYWGMTTAVAPLLPTESIVPPMPVLPPQPPPPAPQPPSALEPMSKVLTDKTKKQKKEKVGVFFFFVLVVLLSLFFFCCYSFICLVFCFGDLFSICVWFVSWVCIGLVFWCFWVSYPFLKIMRFLEKLI